MTSANHPVPKHRAARKVLTVQGPIEPARVGIAMTHEHLLIDFRCVVTKPSSVSQQQLMRQPVSLSNLWWVRHNWTASEDNLLLDDETIAIREVSDYFRAGGSTIVDVTTIGLGRDPQALLRISRATGLNVVMGAGHYIEKAQAPGFTQLAVDEIADSIVHDIEEGVDHTGIRAGIIGEIGCSWPWTEAERRSVEAGVQAQRRTGAPLLIHPGRNERAPLEILNFISRLGGDLTRTVMGHVERTIYDRSILSELAATGAYVNFDLFGHESSFYPLAPETYMPSDQQRIEQIEYMIGEGRADRVLLAHDVCSKHRLKTYGGHGWDHIVARVVPRMRRRGMKDEHVRMILVDNPTRMLTFN